ncbi:kinase-like domain-containing protein [Cladochytrium replicatum]|nr:kinase-like domain-containing protein [Cladochytrium replicatum]
MMFVRGDALAQGFTSPGQANGDERSTQPATAYSNAETLHWTKAAVNELNGPESLIESAARKPPVPRANLAQLVTSSLGPTMHELSTPTTLRDQQSSPWSVSSQQPMPNYPPTSNRTFCSPSSNPIENFHGKYGSEVSAQSGGAVQPLWCHQPSPMELEKTLARSRMQPSHHSSLPPALSQTGSYASHVPNNGPMQAGMKEDGCRKMIGPWVLGKTIGEGSSGKVKIAVHQVTGEKCVVKAVRRPRLAPYAPGAQADAALEKVHKRELYMIREACVGMCLDHPNIVKLNNAVLGEHHFYCFFEYIEGEDLVDYVTRNGRLRERKARSIFRQMIAAIEYSHRNNVVHRDIKLENIRYCESADLVKVLDFGFAAFHSETSNLRTNCGSPCYAAPEIYLNKPYKGPEVDVWSLGVCLYGMVTGGLPFDGPSFRVLSERIKKAKVHYPPYVSAGLRHLISRMLAPSAEERSPLHEVIQHPWVNYSYDTFPVDWGTLLLQTPSAPQAPQVAEGEQTGNASRSSPWLVGSFNSTVYSSISSVGGRESNSDDSSPSGNTNKASTHSIVAPLMVQQPSGSVTSQLPPPVFSNEFVEKIMSCSVTEAGMLLMAVLEEKSSRAREEEKAKIREAIRTNESKSHSTMHEKVSSAFDNEENVNSSVEPAHSNVSEQVEASPSRRTANPPRPPLLKSGKKLPSGWAHLEQLHRRMHNNEPSSTYQSDRQHQAPTFSQLPSYPRFTPEKQLSANLRANGAFLQRQEPLKVSEEGGRKIFAVTHGAAHQEENPLELSQQRGPASKWWWGAGGVAIRLITPTKIKPQPRYSREAPQRPHGPSLDYEITPVAAQRPTRSPLEDEILPDPLPVTASGRAREACLRDRDIDESSIVAQVGFQGPSEGKSEQIKVQIDRVKSTPNDNPAPSNHGGWRQAFLGWVTKSHKGYISELARSSYARTNKQGSGSSKPTNTKSRLPIPQFLRSRENKSSTNSPSHSTLDKSTTHISAPERAPPHHEKTPNAGVVEIDRHRRSRLAPGFIGQGLFKSVSLLPGSMRRDSALPK